MYYYLMNKDKPAAAFSARQDPGISDGIDLELCGTYDKLPIGFSNIGEWLYKRKASNHNKHIVGLMNHIGCNDDETFIRLTHAASINDTFWIRPDNEDISWEKVSLYRNAYPTIISELSFEGRHAHIIFSHSAPEFTTAGSFRKCFRKKRQTGQFGSDIFMYKRGGENDRGFGPYSEMLASEIARIISPDNSVSYELTEIFGHTASVCSLFTDEHYGYAPFSLLKQPSHFNLQFIYDHFDRLGFGQQFREMLVIDSICFNRDRHSGNYGVIFDNETLEIIRMAPVFDLNVSLLSDVPTEQLKHIGNVLYGYSPRLGDDFTRVGQVSLNDTIRERVRDLLDLSFSFRGDDVFPPERVKLLEQIVRRQAAAVLSGEKLYTHDVFPPEELDFS